MKKRKSRILVLFLAVLLVSVMSCENPFLKKMLVEEEKGKTVPQVPKHTINFGVEGGTGGTLKAQVDGKEINSGDSVEQGKSVVFTAEPAEGYVLEQWTNAGTAITEAGTDKTYTHSVTTNADIKVSFDAPFVEGGASLILSPDKLDIRVTAVTSDGSAVAVEGCTETSLASGTYTWLQATGTRVILKGNIIELYCYSNQLTALNVQGLTALQGLWCYSNKLNADAFKKLFDDLPVRADSDDAKCYLYTEETGVSEGNHTDFTAPQDLKDAFDNAKNNKKWKMYKMNGSWPGIEI
ncbi:InlB B-repeat-containing protein [Treponema putidum]|uniref:InlB B-repeat-containing protein n=1 Tax=Treponema putidum TaxID=221027 RepID=UPI003D8E4E19